MKIGLIGTGRLGLCFALLIEKAGYEVLASDSRKDYINDLRHGVVGTAEPDVHDLFGILRIYNLLQIIEE